MADDFECPACMNLDPEDRRHCYHTAEEVPLAKALCMHFNTVDGAEPTTEQIGWFMEDAGALLEDAGPGPYEFTKLGHGWHNEHAFLLNDLVVTLDEGGKDCPPEPQVVARMPVALVGLRKELTDWADLLLRAPGMVPAADVAWKLRQIAAAAALGCGEQQT